MPKHVRGGILFFLGFMLSPLSWWNDVLVNIPLAYAISIPFTLISESLFLPAFVISYWMSNIAGFVLMHVGANDVFKLKKDVYSVKRIIAISLIYTLALVALVLLGWIKPVTEFVPNVKSAPG